MDWLDILRDRIEVLGLTTVARDMGTAKSTVSMVAGGKYPASTERIQARVFATYGGATIACPVLGPIDAVICAETQAKAKRIGLRAGNPETLRLFKTCSNCPVRGAKQGG